MQKAKMCNCVNCKGVKLHCKECGGRGWNYPGVWAAALPIQLQTKIKCIYCKVANLA